MYKNSYPDANAKHLIKAFHHLPTETDIQHFLRDLLTPAEIVEFSKRFLIARLLWATTLSYLEIAQKAETSTTTVTRVAQWLFKENQGGYRLVLKKLYGSAVSR